MDKKSFIDPTYLTADLGIDPYSRTGKPLYKPLNP